MAMDNGWLSQWIMDPIQEIQTPWSEDQLGSMMIIGNNVIQSQPSDNHSLDHHQCLLSGTNSKSDASNVDQDDGISMNNNNMLSDSRNFWNFSNGRKRSSSTTAHHITIMDGQDHPPPRSLKKQRMTSSNISFKLQTTSSMTSSSIEEPDAEAIQQMKEMIYRAAAFRPVDFTAEDTAAVEKPKRKNVKISSDPQTVAARQRREKISERLRVLQKLVPGGTKMDTASMLEEAANYLKFLRNQVKELQALGL